MKAQDQNISIRRAIPGEAWQILALQKLAYMSEAQLYQDFTIPPLTQTREEIEAEFEQQLFLVALGQGKIVGSVRARFAEGTCFVGRLIVSPEMQGQGIGSRLMEAVEASFPQALRFELFTGHKSANNIRFYEKRGYRAFKTVGVNDRLRLVYLEKRFAAKQ